MKYFKDLIKEITYDEIYNYYITENHSVEECNEHFKLAGPMFMRLTKYYGSKKPKALHAANIKKVKKERYGSENYNNAEKRANQVIEEAKKTAQAEYDKIIANAKNDAEQEAIRVKEELRLKMSELVISGAEQILRREINQQNNADILKQIQQAL